MSSVIHNYRVTYCHLNAAIIAQPNAGYFAGLLIADILLSSCINYNKSQTSVTVKGPKYQIPNK